MISVTAAKTTAIVWGSETLRSRSCAAVALTVLQQFSCGVSGDGSAGSEPPCELQQACSADACGVSCIIPSAQWFVRASHDISMIASVAILQADDDLNRVTTGMMLRLQLYSNISVPGAFK